MGSVAAVAIGMGIADAGIERDARAHIVLTGQLDLMHVAMCVQCIGVVHLGVAVLQTNGPRIDIVGDTSGTRPLISAQRNTGAVFVVHIFERAADREAAEGQVQASLVVLLLLTAGTTGGESPGTAAAR